MTQVRSNLVLIGMPGSGKSTVGVILAIRASKGFVDTDILIEFSKERSLQDIVDKDGYIALRKIEEDILLGLSVRNHVIATGGSAAYSDRAMKHLKYGGTIIFLDAGISTLKARVPDFSKRGLAKSPEQSFDQLFQERLFLYKKYADITVKCDGLTQEEVCGRIIEETGKGQSQI